MSARQFRDLQQSVSEILALNDLGRTSFYLPSQGCSLFAWLRFHREGIDLRHGVIICNPIGYEQVHAYRSLRHLAERLANEHVPVLKFDYHGTGDSPGSDLDPNRLSTWQQNIQDAITWMRNELGCQSVTLIGFRFGATLATLVANQHSVDHLVLWAPMISGRQYSRELKALSSTAGATLIPKADDPEQLESAGFIVTGQMVRDISKIDLLATRPECKSALILARDDMPEDQRLLNHFTKLGINCEQHVVSGYAEMLALPHFIEVPKQAICDVVRWFKNIRGEVSQPVSALPEITVKSKLMFEYSASSAADASKARILEVPMQLSTEPNLFGILSEPEASVDPARPLVLLLNGGSAYRVGPNRLYVPLARELASQGFQCFRLDVCGLGDSLMQDADAENHSYPNTVFRDVQIVVNQLASKLGIKRVILMGLCSGGYNSFQAAARVPSPLIVESVVINPLTFFWKDGMVYEVPKLKQINDWNYYLQSAIQPKKWLKLLFGKTQIGFSGALRMAFQYGRTLNKAEAKVDHQSCQNGCNIVSCQSEDENIPRDLARIEKFGRRVSFIFATTEPGYSMLMFAARRSVRRLRRAGKLDVTFIENADHTFSMSAPRTELIRLIIEQLKARYAN